MSCVMRVRHAHLVRPYKRLRFQEQKNKSHSYVIKVVLDIFNIIVGNNKNDSLKLMPPNIKNYNWMTGNKQMLYKSYATIWL